MSKTIKIPATVEEATAQLGGLGALLTAKSWERAAIVYAFTTDEIEGGPRTGRKSRQLSLREFADLAIAGLRDRETVAWVRQAWDDAIEDSQARAVKPGDAVTLPAREFPKHPRTRSAVDGFAAQLRKNPDAVKELLHDQPELIPELAQQIVKHPGLRPQVESLTAERERTVYQPHLESAGTDYGRTLRHAAGELSLILSAVTDGKWAPDAMERTLLAFIAAAAQELADGNTPTADLFDQIESYLGAART